MDTPLRLPTGAVAEWTTIPALFAARARDAAARRDIEIAGRAISYGELDVQSAAVAANLHRLGVRKGDRVASLQQNDLEQVLVWLGANRIGAIWVPMNAGLVGDDLAYTLRDAAPKVLVVGAELHERVLAVGEFGFACQVFVAAPADPNLRSFTELLAPADPAPAVAVAAADPAVIIYTGGTTGLPKGAVLPQFAWIAAGYRFIQAFRVQPTDRYLSVLTLYHVGGLMLGLLGPVMAGIPTHIEKRFSVASFWERVRATGATIIDPVGSMVPLLLQQPESPLDRAHQVRAMINGAAQAPAGTRERFTSRFGVPMVNLYSLTECGGVLIVNNPVDSTQPEANGQGWGWAEVGVVDEHDVPVAPGTIGQIVLRPRLPHIFMSGYHNNPQRSLETMANLWMHTGDLGYLDAAGWLYFTGRQVHWMRRRGENISAYEIESILTQHPAVREVIAVGVPSELGEEEVKVFIIPDAAHDDARPDPVALIEWCKTRMAAFKIPRFVEFVSDFPRSATKMEIERAKLKALPNDQAWDRERVMGRLSGAVPARRD